MQAHTTSSTDTDDTLPVRQLGTCDYLETYQAMTELTAMRNASSHDEFWYLQHHPVYTLGLNGKRHHLLQETAIPLVKSDRGGQITYHGPGQLVTYLLVDIARRQLGIKDFVYRIEQALINLLADYQIQAARLAGAPGIYVDGAKIAALGLRVKQGRTYHGLALNLDMDLSPFQDINPCGYHGMAVTQLTDLIEHAEKPIIEAIAPQLHDHLCRELGYNASSLRI